MSLEKDLGILILKNDLFKYNLVDPVERNTVGVPAGGWVAIRFLADNQGLEILYVLESFYSLYVLLACYKHYYALSHESSLD